MDNTRMETAMDTSISSAHHTRFEIITLFIYDLVFFKC